MSDIITSDDILGKEAVDPEGSILGIVVKLHISSHKKQITGITIDQGFMRPDLFIGVDHLKFFGVDTVMLSKVPEIRFKGMHVITEGGNEIGIVRDVELEEKKLKAIKVSPHNLRERDFFVASEDIREIGARVLLKDKFKVRAEEARHQA